MNQIFALLLLCGMFISFLLGVYYRNHFFTRLWIEVEPEFEFHVVKTIQAMKLCKKSVVYALPSLIYNKNMKPIYEPPTTTIVIELSLNWFGLYKNDKGNEVYTALNNIVERIEQKDLRVINSGVY